MSNFTAYGHLMLSKPFKSVSARSSVHRVNRTLGSDLTMEKLDRLLEKLLKKYNEVNIWFRAESTAEMIFNFFKIKKPMKLINLIVLWLAKN
eukprot:UN29182